MTFRAGRSASGKDSTLLACSQAGAVGDGLVNDPPGPCDGFGRVAVILPALSGGTGPRLGSSPWWVRSPWPPPR